MKFVRVARADLKFIIFLLNRAIRDSSKSNDPLKENTHFCIIDVKGVAKMSCAILAHVKKDVRENRVAFFTWKKYNFL